MSATATSFAATFRNVDGDQVRTTWGGTICWYPRDPAKLRSYDSASDTDHVIRCGWCAGCREFDRRRLADRLQRHYEKEEREIWILIIECPIERQSLLRRRFSQTTTGRNSEGFYRLSVKAFALIVRGQKLPLRAMRTLRGSKCFWEKVRRSRKRRAWATLTTGMLESRETWGEFTNRYYQRNLPTATRQNWSIDTRQGLRKKQSGASPGVRAHRNGEFLYPPEAWKPPRLIRRRGPTENRIARSASVPKAGLVHPLAGLITDALAHLSPTAAPKARLNLVPESQGFSIGQPSASAGMHASKTHSPQGMSGTADRPRKDRSLNLIQGAGYKGSADLDSEWKRTLERFASLGKPKPP